VYFPYGKGSIALSLPENVDLVTYRAASEEEAPGDERSRFARALAAPIGSPPLAELARGRSDAVILISDITRLSPSARFLPALLDALNEGGLPDERIRIVVALGTHRRMTDDELRLLAGEAYGRVAVENHSCDPADCVDVGTTPAGTRVSINRRVVEADLRIATGNIEPHRLVGVSGGIKALFPGVAAAPSIEQHHALSQSHRAVPGYADNPLHRDLEDAAALCPIHFVFNVVVDAERNVLGIYAGDPSEAHRRGTAFARERFLVPVERRYDIVVASAGGAPKDMQMYQAIKALENAAGFAKTGGVLLLIASCEELYGNGVFQLWAELSGDRARAVERLQRRFVLGAHKLQLLDAVLSKHEVHLLSELPAPIAELLGFRPVEDAQAWVDAYAAAATDRSIAAIPYASLTFPHEP